RFSAFRTRPRPARREIVSEPYTGVTRACPPMRSRAASMSATVGAVFVANLEHLVEDLTDGRERVELAPLHLVQQPPQLGVARDRALEMVLCPRRGDREHLGREVAPAPLVEAAVGGEVVAVRLDLLPERLDALAAQRLGEDDRRPPVELRPEGEHLP